LKSILKQINQSTIF